VTDEVERRQDKADTVLAYRSSTERTTAEHHSYNSKGLERYSPVAEGCRGEDDFDFCLFE
jgi:hypothetical protein